MVLDGERLEEVEFCEPWKTQNWGEKVWEGRVEMSEKAGDWHALSVLTYSPSWYIFWSYDAAFESQNIDLS